jgi:hypothetical protein
MERDASLEEFLDGGDGDSMTSDDSEETAASDDKEPDDGGGVMPATSTGYWVSGGAACAECGAVVERRWRDGDAFVCGDCKSW